MNEQTHEVIPVSPEDVKRLAQEGHTVRTDPEGHQTVMLPNEVFLREKARIEKAKRARARAKRKAANASRRGQRE